MQSNDRGVTQGAGQQIAVASLAASPAAVRLNGSYDVLIYGPITPSGLTTQITQLTSIFETHGVSYRITHRYAPALDHRANQFWVSPHDYGDPKIIILMERFPDFFLKNPRPLKIFYLNLDWLNTPDFLTSKRDADVVLYPIEYRYGDICDEYKNSRVLKLKWPASCPIRPVPESPLGPDDDIYVLYVGNEIDDKSRKNPYPLLDAIQRTTNRRLKFLLKFRTKIPAHYRTMLEQIPSVEVIQDSFVPPKEVEALYERAHVNLIPNDSEGNGLSILEAIAKGVLPAVLNGVPMNEVVREDFGWLIPCKHIGKKGMGDNFQTDSEALLSVLDALDRTVINQKRKALRNEQMRLAEREESFRAAILDLLALRGIPKHAHFRKLPPRELVDKYLKPVELIDVYMTTSRRPRFFAKTFEALLRACDASPYEHRITVLADRPDPETLGILAGHAERINLVTSNEQLGLPFMWNLVHDYSLALSLRTERRPDFICYIQDDCLINEPADYFRVMVECQRGVLSPDIMGYVSGFYCPIHPGFEKKSYNGLSVLLSDSIDGKNFMAPPKLIYHVGKLSWHFPDGERRGNPGPRRGSHFDLWQWKESPNSLTSLNRVSVVIPGLCSHIAQEAVESTWGNATTNQAQATRVAGGRVYKTRKTQLPVLEASDFYKGHVDGHSTQIEADYSPDELPVAVEEQLSP